MVKNDLKPYLGQSVSQLESTLMVILAASLLFFDRDSVADRKLKHTIKSLKYISNSFSIIFVV